MKERILRLCKRLNKFSLDEIINIADDISESVLELLLTTFVDEQKLVKQGDIFFYNSQVQINRKKFPLFFEYQDSKTVDLIVRCFCCKVPIADTEHILQLSETSLLKYHLFFRKCLYDSQFDELNQKYLLQPKLSTIRTLFDRSILFYTYNSNVYVSERSFYNQNAKKNSKEEIKEFKKIYSYLKRLESHNSNNINIYYKIAESLWRRGKKTKDLYESLKKITGL